MAHAKKHIITRFSGEFTDATVYTSGGTTYTVELENAFTGEKTRKTFRGYDARGRAIDYANGAAK